MVTERNDLAGIIIDKALEWSVYLPVLFLPFSKSMIEICVAVGISLLLIKKISTRDFKFPNTPANIPLLFVFITAALSLINSHQYMSLSLRALVSKNLKFIFLYFLIVESIDNRTKLNNLLKIASISAILVFADVFIQYFVTHEDLAHNYVTFKYVYGQYTTEPDGQLYGSFIGYPTGPFPFPNDLSAWLLIVMPTAFFLSLFGMKDTLRKYSLFAFSLTGLYIFILAKSRAAWAGLIIAFASLIFLVRKKTVVFLMFGIMLVLIVFCYFTSARVVFGLSSMTDRTDMWSNGIKIFREHPIIGSGINTFFNRYKDVRHDRWRGLRGSYAHNCYLQMASDTGILGLTAFLWFVGVIFKNAFDYIKRTPGGFNHALVTGLIIGLCAFLIHSAFDTNLYSLPLASLFWISTGLVTAVIGMDVS